MGESKSGNNKISLKKRAKSFKYAFDGILYLVKSQHNAWVHLTIAIFAIIAGIALDVSFTEWCFLVFAIGFVLVAEAFNTAIEELTNLVSPAYDKKAGTVKDVAAGAVLISAIVAAIVGLIIFIPKIVLLFP
ncbi:MAG: diacylglycerol kinase family protein [Chlorobi bacterium]|nr:diacylglycerol kinase family protein [Chlorobiota bacterium]